VNKTKWDHLLSIMSDEDLERLRRILCIDAHTDHGPVRPQSLLMADDIRRILAERAQASDPLQRVG
jgi:hypothetical protein